MLSALTQTLLIVEEPKGKRGYEAMILYHVTRREDAVMIQAGFQDGPHAPQDGRLVADRPWRSRMAAAGRPSWRSCSTCPAEALRQYEWDDP